MKRALDHRGPDAFGVFDRPGVVLAQTRLRLIDLSANADPPYQTDDEKVVSVLNGEIYNHQELRDEVLGRGVRLKSGTDGELLPHLWRIHGVDFLSRLRGAFAIALYDSTTQSLLLARDRMGEKPLYFARDEEWILFASELGALMSSGQIEQQVDRSVLEPYLRYGDIPAPNTGLQGVNQVMPGTCQIWRQGNLETHPYWSLPTGGARPWRDALDSVEEILSSSVREQLCAERPLGVFLSGGIDSGLILSMAESRAVSAYTWSPSDPRCDELKGARETAKRFGQKLTVVDARPDGPQSFFSVLDRVGQPLADSALFAMDALCRRAKEDVSAVLCGEGGDELFFGYRRWRALGLTRFWPLRHRGGSSQRAALGGRLSTYARFIRGMSQGVERANSYWRSVFWDDDIASLIGMQKEPQDNSGGRSPDLEALLKQTQKQELLGPLPDGLLVKTDRLSMAYGLEARCPFLDFRLVEEALSLSSQEQCRGPTKPLLRELSKNRLPESIVKGKKKGLAVPLDQWFRNDLKSLEPWFYESVSSIFQKEFVRRLWREHQDSQADHSRRLLALASWTRFEERIKESARGTS